MGLPYGILVLPLMWLPETVVVIGRPSVWMTDWWGALTVARVALGTLWVFAGCTLSVREVYKVPVLRAASYTLGGIAAGLALSSVFIR
jgi:hypothetical protein